jgi:hypothetical protein
MQAFVVYESMYGNTAKIAEAIGRGLTDAGLTVLVEPFNHVPPEQVVDADLLVVGGPTHAHGMSHEATRDTARTDDKNTYEEPGPEPGLRQWLHDLPEGAARPAATFDTRLHGPALFTGSAAKHITSRLEDRGFQIAAEPESFFVTKSNQLMDGEEARAQVWAADTARLLEQVMGTPE